MMKLYQKVPIVVFGQAFIHKKLMIFLCAKVEIFIKKSADFIVTISVSSSYMEVSSLLDFYFIFCIKIKNSIF